MRVRQASAASLRTLSEGADGMEKIEELQVAVSIQQKVTPPFLLIPIGVGISIDALFNDASMGINTFLSTTTLCGTLMLMARFGMFKKTYSFAAMNIVAILVSGGFIWRSSPTLRFFDLCIITLCLSLAAFARHGGRVIISSLLEYLLAIFSTFIEISLGGLSLLAYGINWKAGVNAAWFNLLTRGLTGMLIAVPVLLIFGGLFCSADQVFKHLIDTTFRFDVGIAFSHIFLSLLAAYFVGGFVSGLVFTNGTKLAHAATVKPVSLGLVESSMVFASVDLLFLLFVLVQFQHFFGGAQVVTNTLGLSYAEYARSGFFELVTASALVLPMVLLGDWLLPNTKLAKNVFKLLAGWLIIMVMVIMASAVERMHLYQLEYGLSELRIYATALMGWLTLMFTWMGVTVLRNQRDKFAFGAFLSGILVVIGLHAINPDALIAEVNLNRVAAGHTVDTDYLASLSSDADSALAAGLSKLDPPQRAKIAEKLEQSRARESKEDWRSWSISRSISLSALKDKGALLSQALDAVKTKEIDPHTLIISPSMRK
jgi:hypothetical protein